MRRHVAGEARIARNLPWFPFAAGAGLILLRQDNGALRRV
jgi:hypothetical protein